MSAKGGIPAERRIRPLNWQPTWRFARAISLRYWGLFVLAWMILRAANAGGLTTTPAGAEDWLVRSWQTKDGLPQNTVNAILQTRDGYLWVGTSGGLARFDGVSFRVFGLQDGLSSVQISALVEDRPGNLWIGTKGGGVSCWRDGVITALPARGIQSLAVQALAVAEDGTLWIGTDGGLVSYQNGVLKAMGEKEGLPQKPVRALLIDSKGVLWVSEVVVGLFKRSNDRFMAVEANSVQLKRVYSLCEGSDGSMWAGGMGELWQIRGEICKPYGRTNGLPANSIDCVAPGREGSLWVGARDSGLYFLNADSFQKVDIASEVYGDSIRRLMLDRDGNIWMGTGSVGLHRLSHKSVRVWDAAEGLGHPQVNSIAEDAAGSLWLSTQNGGPYCLRDGRFSRLKDPIIATNSQHAYTALCAGDGSIWIGGDQFLYHFPTNQVPEAYLAPPVGGDAIRAMCEDGEGICLGTYYSALLRFQAGQIQILATNGSFAGAVTSLIREAPGTLWIGTMGGLYRWERGQVTRWTTDNGLLCASIQALHRDPDGTLWAGTLGGGLARLKQGRIANVTTKQGLIDDVISQIVSDDLGNLWLGCNHGIMRLDRGELDSCAEGKAAFVHPTVFGQDNGMLSEQCAGGSSPTALKTRDGRLLFPTARGLVEIDPRWPPATNIVLQASIEELLVDGQSHGSAGPFNIPPGTHRAQVNYTAPSLSSGRWVHFRYRLDPADKVWVDAGSQRNAAYMNLRPGHYTFRVTASQSPGRWNGKVASMDIVVHPQFWQTLWFRTAATLMIAAAAFAAYRQRSAGLERQRMAQELVTRQIILSQENERKRVASELHDGLSQNLALLSIELEMLSQRLPGTPEQIGARLAELTQQTKGISAELHRVSHGLHPAKLTQLGLVVALRGFCREMEAAHGIGVRFTACPLPRDLPEDVALCLYRVTQEAIQNVIKHSGARLAQVELERQEGALVLTIADDGQGFEVGAPRAKSSLGLVGMRERAHAVQGEIAIESKPGEGTRVKVRIPLTEKRAL